MKVNLTKPAVALDGSPLFESKESIGVGLASYLMSISTPNPREMQALSSAMLANKPFNIEEPVRDMLEKLVIGSNLMNILKIQLLDELEVPVEAAKEVAEDEIT